MGSPPPHCKEAFFCRLPLDAYRGQMQFSPVRVSCVCVCVICVTLPATKWSWRHGTSLVGGDPSSRPASQHHFTFSTPRTFQERILRHPPVGGQSAVGGRLSPGVGQPHYQPHPEDHRRRGGSYAQSLAVEPSGYFILISDRL